MRDFKYYLLLILYVVFFVNNINAADGDGSLSDSNVQYIGRWDKSDNNEFHSY
ncbi:hypothetical protein [Joostella sp.]|uniref:hypothetical protein n=1 Tax=Joostella sp. TaxID=2231138 RepID=UPI003A8F7752